MTKYEKEALAAAQTIEDYCHARKKCAGCVFDRGDCILKEPEPPSLWFIEDLEEEGGNI